MAAWSEFEDCTFTQRRTCRVLNASGEAAQGSFGNAPFLYRRCRFDGCVWVGESSGPDEERRNIIVANDFTGAAIGPKVAWRFNFDVDAQHWPAGYHPTVN